MTTQRVLPIYAWRSTRPVSSGLVIPLKITLEWRINLQINWRRVVDKVQMNISPSNIFRNLPLWEIYHQNSQAVLAATGMMNGSIISDINLMDELWSKLSDDECTIDMNRLSGCVHGSCTYSHSCLEIYLTSVVWTYHTFENNFRMEHEITKCLRESCRWSSDEQFSSKIFWILLLLERYRQNCQTVLAVTGMNGLNTLIAWSVMVVVSGLLALLWSYGLVVLFDMQMRLCDRIYDIIYIVNWNELCCHWNVMYDLLVNNSWLIPIAFWEILLLVFETYLNPLMLTAAKNSLTILMQSCRQKQMWKTIWRRNVVQNFTNYSPSNIL